MNSLALIPHASKARFTKLNSPFHVSELYEQGTSSIISSQIIGLLANIYIIP